MEIAKIIETLRDPMGVPFYPIIFQFLMVLTFALHILFVNFTLGTSFISIYGYLTGGENWRRLSNSLVKATIVNVSMAMLFGIAPLLFVQVIYDPFWYTSNTLSAVWVILFILFMMTAYTLTYILYFKSIPGEKSGFAIFGIIAFVLFLFAGFIMHVLNFQLLHPDKWPSWYFKGVSVNVSGSSFHSFQIPRFLHFIIPSFSMTGIYLLLFAWYFKEREDIDKNYLQWVGKKGANLAFVFTLIQVVIGFWWLFSVSSKFTFYLNPFLLLGFLLTLVLLSLLYSARKEPFKYAIPSITLGFLTIFLMSYARESLRIKYLGDFGYSIFNYKLNIEWGSTFLFLFTFIMGLIVAGYLWFIAFKSGRTAKEYLATAGTNRWGKISIALLIIWIVIVAGLGVVITLTS